MYPQYRWGVFKGMFEAIDKNEGGLDKFTQGALEGLSSSSNCKFLSPDPETPATCRIMLRDWH